MAEYSIGNIARVDVQTEETTPTTHKFIDVAQECTVGAKISSGQEQELRVKNTIHAQIITEDIIKGYEITLRNALGSMELLALVDGGTYDETSREYTGPVAGSVTERTKFTLTIYQEIKDYDGGITGYISYEFKHCVGTPVSFNLRDGEFTTQELKIVGRPKKDESSISITEIDTLPA